MAALPTITFREFNAAVLAGLRAHFAGIDLQISAGELIDVATGDPADTLTAPWLRFYAYPAGVDRSVRRTPGRVPVRHACQIQCCLSTKTEDFQTELAEFAGNVFSLVFGWEDPGQRARDGRLQIGQRWGLGAAVEPPTMDSGYPGALNSLPHGHDALIVAWEQTIYRPERLTANDPLIY